MGQLQEAGILILDFDPSSGMGKPLRTICEDRTAYQVQLKIQVAKACPTSIKHAAAASLIEKTSPDIVFLVLPPRSADFCHRIIETIRSHGSAVPVVAVSQDASAEEPIDLLKSGAIDFITPPLRAVDVLPRIWRLMEALHRCNPVVEKLKRSIGLGQLVGDSPRFLAELEKIPYVAKSNATVLISGETGTGKEVFARAIHYLSLRSGHAFVPVNCGSIPLELVENELFGHVRGAFTGANAEQAGLFRDADGGTVFLDEVDCLPLSAQTKLLRFLQDKEYRRLGSAKIVRADVRIVAATNVDLAKAVDQGGFRRDLFYRLNVIPLSLPALRDRIEDVPALARHFLQKYASTYERDIGDFTEEALRKLALYDWPGNIRELENVIERAAVFTKASVIDACDISLLETHVSPGVEPFQSAKANAVEKFEKDYLQRLLTAHGGNISRAARAAQKNRRAFWELIRKHHINTQHARHTVTKAS